MILSMLTKFSGPIFVKNSDSVAEYFKESETVDANKSSCQKSQGYKSVLNSKASEDSLVSN